MLEHDVVQSHAMAQQEVERYTYRAPGQANSYFYGYTKLIALRKDVEAALGPKFNAKKFHDFFCPRPITSRPDAQSSHGGFRKSSVAKTQQKKKFGKGASSTRATSRTSKHFSV